MEAFDVMYSLCRYHNYSQDETESAYHLLLQAEALENIADPLLTGFLCFYRAHDTDIAKKILSQSTTAEEVIEEVSQKEKKIFSKQLAVTLRKIKES